MGGLTGVVGATIFTGCVALLIVAGTYGLGLMDGKEVIIKPTGLMDAIMGEQVAKVFWLLLAIAAFPPACFSSLIAAASFKNTLPKVNPFISCGIGTAASIGLVLSGYAGDAAAVFGIIGASFGPICGAMAADYILAGFKWPGPRVDSILLVGFRGRLVSSLVLGGSLDPSWVLNSKCLVHPSQRSLSASCCTSSLPRLGSKVRLWKCQSRALIDK